MLTIQYVINEFLLSICMLSVMILHKCMMDYARCASFMFLGVHHRADSKNENEKLKFVHPDEIMRIYPFAPLCLTNDAAFNI